MSENVVTILKNSNVTDIQHCWNPDSVVIQGVGDYKDFSSSESNNTNGSRNSNTQPHPHTNIKTDLMSIFRVAWCREDEVRLFEMFPEILMFDVTHKTNNEKRPLGIFVGIDQNMDVFNVMRVFIPSECQWVMNWIFASVCPSLLGKEPLQ